MYKNLYSLFLEAQKGIQHYASHSHHYWPDVTRAAQIEYWDDAARLVDRKWDYIFGLKVPETQKRIASVLNLSDPEMIAFAPNTHELLFRLLSSFDLRKKISVLTTDAEFYSFDRQITQMVTHGYAEVTRVAALPPDFTGRFVREIRAKRYDVIFFSQVFFNSGLVVEDLNKIVEAARESESIIVIDGYHAFMAVPTDLSDIEDRVYYLAGSYKYAQGGEGCCFMAVPQSNRREPLFTGWFAGFNTLTDQTRTVEFSASGLRFAGSSMDFGALYRLNAVLRLYADIGLTPQKIHRHVRDLQLSFLESLDELNHPYLNRKFLLARDQHFENHGHFLTFDLPSVDICTELKKDLEKSGIVTDSRGPRLRFGFGLYQNEKIDFSLFKKTATAFSSC